MWKSIREVAPEIKSRATHTSISKHSKMRLGALSKASAKSDAKKWDRTKKSVRKARASGHKKGEHRIQIMTAHTGPQG
jgi:hypothetical protein